MCITNIMRQNSLCWGLPRSFIQKFECGKKRVFLASDPAPLNAYIDIYIGIEYLAGGCDPQTPNGVIFEIY
jgi:hypothetical protein